MYSMNQLTIIGFTGTDAETHYTTSGTLVTTLSVATKESWKGGNGEWPSELTGTALLLSRALENMRLHYPKARTC